MNKKVLFFVGTEAELIKLFPIMIECANRGLDYSIIASGQNDICNSLILKTTGIEKPEVILSNESDIKKSASGLLKWFVTTYLSAKKKIEEQMKDVDFSNSLMVVHGDTVSTLMGALVGKKLGMKVCHVEAGLRSHHLFNPFPEEIDRLLTSRRANVHFAPGQSPCDNLKKAKGTIINTKLNTIIDSLRYAMSMDRKTGIEDKLKDNYFVFVLHRQENLMNKVLVQEIVEEIQYLSQKMQCVIILHKITELTFEKNGLMDGINNNPNIVTIPRMNYFDFMKLLYGSQFVLTDGGSNQEELHYMGKPCLILRKTTERMEGIGSNAMLYMEQPKLISDFIVNYKEKEIPAKMDDTICPSGIIVDELQALIAKSGK